MISELKVGILGAGAIGTTHAASYKKIEGVDVAGISSRNAEKAQTVAKEFDTKGHTDPYKLIKDTSIDAIDVCVPSRDHRKYVIAALENDKHVFCETPFALSLEDAEAMIKIAKVEKKILQVGLLMRSISYYRYIKDKVVSGEMGKIASASTYRLGSYLLEGGVDAKEHYTDPSTELMTFDFDFMNWLLGKPRSLSATAINTEKGTPGEITATLDYGNNITATIIGSGIRPITDPYTVGFRVAFEKGVYELKTIFEDNEPNNTFTYQPNGEEPQQVNLEGFDPFEYELKYFIETIRGEESGELLSAEHALNALKLSVATSTSLNSNRTITL